MPDVPDLWDRARALSVISLVGGCDDNTYDEEGRYEGNYAFSRRGEGWRFTLSHQSQIMDMHFTDAGVFAAWWDRDAGFRSCDGHLQDWWRTVLDQVLQPFKPLLYADDTVFYREEDHSASWVTGVLWRLQQDTGWRIPRLPPSPFDADSSFEDSSATWIFEDVIARDFGRLSHPHLVRNQGMRDPAVQEWAWLEPEEIDWPDTGMTEEEATGHILALKPVTDRVVRTFHPTRVLADVQDAIVSTGYPQPDPPLRTAP